MKFLVTISVLCVLGCVNLAVSQVTYTRNNLGPYNKKNADGGDVKGTDASEPLNCKEICSESCCCKDNEDGQDAELDGDQQPENVDAGVEETAESEQESAKRHGKKHALAQAHAKKHSSKKHTKKHAKQSRALEGNAQRNGQVKDPRCDQCGCKCENNQVEVQNDIQPILEGLYPTPGPELTLDEAKLTVLNTASEAEDKKKRHAQKKHKSDNKKHN